MKDKSIIREIKSFAIVYFKFDENTCFVSSHLTSLPDASQITFNG